MESDMLSKKHVSIASVFVAGLIVSACGFGSSPTPRVNVDENAKTQSVFSLPNLSLPRFGDRNFQSGMPAAEVQCRRQLKRMGVSYRDIPAIRDNANCGIQYPVELTTLARGVAITPPAKLNCQTALASAQWIQRDVGPAARKRYLSGIAEVRQMSAYSCRRIRGNGQWSEHASGNALDIGSFKLKNGRVIDVARPSLFAFRAKSFLTSVRGQACGRFGTVLGPGDRDHHDHFHFDLRQRSRVYCSMH